MRRAPRGPRRAAWADGCFGRDVDDFLGRGVDDVVAAVGPVDPLPTDQQLPGVITSPLRGPLGPRLGRARYVRRGSSPLPKCNAFIFAREGLLAAAFLHAVLVGERVLLDERSSDQSRLRVVLERSFEPVGRRVEVVPQLLEFVGVVGSGRSSSRSSSIWSRNKGKASSRSTCRGRFDRSRRQARSRRSLRRVVRS